VVADYQEVFTHPFRGLTTTAPLKHGEQRHVSAARIPFRGLTTTAPLKPICVNVRIRKGATFPWSHDHGSVEAVAAVRAFFGEVVFPWSHDHGSVKTFAGCRCLMLHPDSPLR